MLRKESSGEGENDKGGWQVDVNRTHCRGLSRSSSQYRIMCHHSSSAVLACPVLPPEV